MSNLIDKNILKELVSKFSILGITEKDAKVYLALLSEDAPVGSSKLITATEMHGQFVYNSLNKLEHLGLVKHSVINGRKKFSALPPTRFTSLIEEKKIVASDLIDQLQSYISPAIRQDFEVYQGESAFVVSELELTRNTKPGDYRYIIGGASDSFVKIMGSSMSEVYKYDVKNNIEAKYIGTLEEKAGLEQTKKDYPYFQYRIMPSWKSGIINTIIRPLSVSIVSYDQPILSYILKNKTVSQNYKDFFESLWLLCK